MGKYKEVSNLLPKTIAGAINEPPISEVMKIVGKGKIVVFLKAELVLLSSRISVSGNITSEQLEFISTQLVEFFPNESLADFKLCFERGCMGQYGEIFRMDGIVLRKWMEQYLDEKYQVVETNLVNERDTLYRKPEPKKEEDQNRDEKAKDWLRIWREEVDKVAGVKSPSMTREDVLKWGQSEPPKKESVTSGYKYFQVKNVQVLALTQEHAEELVQKMIKSGDLEEF